MGKGKGEVEYWAAVVKPGTVLFELAGVSEEAARATFARLAHKLPGPLPVRHPAAHALTSRRPEQTQHGRSRADRQDRRP